MGKQREKLTLGIELIDDANWMGGTLYLRNLAVCLARLPEEERPNIRLLGGPDIIARFFDECGKVPGIEVPGRQTLIQGVLQRIGRKQERTNQIDVVYPGFGQGVPGATTVRWIPDFQHRYLPELFSQEEITARDRSIGHIANRPGVVVLSSEVAAKDFRDFYPDHSATPRVWHFCSLLDTSGPPPLDPRGKFGLPDKFLYLPNQFWAHKNHITVLKALSHLRKMHKLVIPLVCTGAKSDRRNLDHFTKLQQFIRDNNMSDQVHLMGLLDRKEQVAVLRFAAAVIQPSLFEGWSTVVEDVRAVGRTIFLSDLPVHREQSPDNCSYFTPDSDEELASLLLNQWENLEPGLDMVSEKNARIDLENRILKSARIFNEIIFTASNIPSATAEGK